MKSKHALIAFLILLLLGGGILLFEKPFSPPKPVAAKLFPDFNPAIASLVRIQHGKEGIELLKENGLWRVGHFTSETGGQAQADTLTYLADPDSVRILLEAISRIETGTVVSSNPEKYPLFHVGDLGTQVDIKGGTFNAGFILGKNGPDQGVFLKKTSPQEDPKVYFVSENLTPLFLKNLPEWREKRVIWKDTGELQEIKIKQGRESFTFKRDPEKNWVLEEKPKAPLKIEAVETLARALSHVTALTVGEKASTQEAQLDQPGAQVLLKFSGETQELQLSLGKMKEGDTFYASLQGLKDWEKEIFTVSQSLSEKLKSPLEKYLITP